MCGWAIWLRPHTHTSVVLVSVLIHSSHLHTSSKFAASPISFTQGASGPGGARVLGEEGEPDPL